MIFKTSQLKTPNLTKSFGKLRILVKIPQLTPVQVFNSCRAIFLGLALIWSSPALSLTKEEAVAYVQKNYGPIVAKSELPETYKITESMFDRLVEVAVSRVTEFDSSGTVEIVRSSVANAFVATLKSAGQSRAKNLVFVTTGMLDKLLKNASTPSEVSARFELLAGVLAHELGHPVDKLDSNGIENHYAKAGNQAIEVRVDTEAISILRNAGFAPDLVLKSLDFLQADAVKATNVAHSTLSTHPDFDIRTSAQRLALTLDRLEKGTMSESRDLPVIGPNLILERNKLKMNETIATPNNAQAAMQLLRTSANPKDRNRFRKFNFYALVLANYFEKLGKFSNYSPADQALFSSFIEVLTGPAAEIAVLAESKTTVRQLLQTSDLEFLGGDARPVIERLRATEYFAPSKPHFRKHIASFELPFRIQSFLRIVATPELMKTLSDEELVHFSMWLARSSLETSLQFFRRSVAIFDGLTGQDLEKLSLGDFRYLLPSADQGFFKDIESGRKTKSANSTDLRDATEIAQKIWAARGFIASLELLEVTGIKPDWVGIAQILKIDPRQVKTQILTEVKRALSTTSRESHQLEALIAKLESKWSPDSREVFLDNVGGALPPWADESLTDVVTRANSRLKRLAAPRLARQLPSLRMKQSRALARLLSWQSLRTSRDVLAAVETWVTDQYAVPRTNEKFVNESLLDLIRVLGSAPQQQTGEIRRVIRELLPTLILRRHSGVFASKRGLTELYRLSTDLGIVKTFPEFLSLITGKTRPADIYSSLLISRLGRLEPKAVSLVAQETISAFAPTIAAELAQANTKKLTRVEAKQLIDLYLSHLSEMKFASRMPEREQIAAEFVKLARQAELTEPQKLEFFLRVTNLITTKSTDAYFKSDLLAVLKSKSKTEILSRILKRGRVFDGNLQVSLTKDLIQPRIEAAAKGSKLRSVDLFDLAEEMHSMSKIDSSNRDAMIEGAAWNSGASGTQLRAYFEDEKSSNWRKGNPRLVQAGSAVGAIIRELNTTEKLELLDYVMTANSETPMPQKLANMINRRFEKMAEAAALSGSTPQDFDPATAAYETRMTLENLISTTQPAQRTPILDVLLSSGNMTSLLASPTLFSHIIETVLGLKAGTPELEMMRAYLDVIPVHERSVTLAYALANKHAETGNSGGGNLKSVLEVFFTVGIKFGQMAATWNIFGPEYQAELLDLNDRAKPMTKYEIETELTKSLSPDERRNITKIESIIGSASVKTVMKVKLASGKQVALMLRRPNAPEQILSNMTLAKKFLARLKEGNLGSSHPLFSPLILALEEQLGGEIDFRNEVEKISTLRKIIGAQGRNLSPKLSGFRLQVPNVDTTLNPRANVFLMDLANGVSMKTYLRDPAVPASEKQIIGEAITAFSLNMLFKHGYFDPDRHSGNFMIDRANKIVSFIDPGQLIHFGKSKNPLKSDPRFVLAAFMTAFQAKQTNTVLRFAKQMSNSADSLTTAQEDKLRVKIESALNLPAMDEALKAVVTEIYGSGLRLDSDYAFGALKGFMTLYGQGYVSAEKFTELLTAEIKPVLLKKAPLTALELVRAVNFAPKKSARSQLCSDAFAR